MAGLPSLLTIPYDMINFKEPLSWGYKLLLSQGAEDRLARNLIMKSNHLNEWLLGKGKEKTNCPKTQESKAAGKNKRK